MPKSTYQLDIESLTDAALIHNFRNGRAQLRRKELTDRLRAVLDDQLPRLWDEAMKRGIPKSEMLQWREYPHQLVFGYQARGLGGEVEPVPPPTRKRKRHQPAATNGHNGNGHQPDAGAMLDAVEAELFHRMGKGASPALRQPNGRGAHPEPSPAPGDGMPSDSLTDALERSLAARGLTVNGDSVSSNYSAAANGIDKSEYRGNLTSVSQPTPSHHSAGREGRMSPTTVKSNGKPTDRTADLLKEHAKLVAEYPATTGAAKAQVVRKLNLLQVELDLIGAEYDYWTKPEPVVTRSYTLDPEQLRERIVGLRKLMDRADRPEAAKATAARELELAIKQCEARGIEVPA